MCNTSKRHIEIRELDTMATPTPISAISIDEVRAAEKRIAGTVMRTPLVRLNVDDTPAEIYLKLENMHPVGSFKLRGAMNAILLAGKEKLRNGVWTVSSGNMAIAMAWSARYIGVPCSVVVADDAPQTKFDAIEQLGATTVKAPWDDVLEVARSHTFDGVEGYFIHPFANRSVVAGNGTIALEVLQDLPDVDAILAPYGGGGLATGVASAVRAVKPDVKVYATEVETGAPVAASFASGKPTDVDFSASFVSGIGTPAVFPEVWPLASSLLDGSLVATLAETAAAVRLIAQRNHVIAEGAGATPVAAALSGKAGSGKVVCIVSGGNIDTDKLVKILEGGVP